MKVILTAFNGLLKSAVLEWPEMPPDSPVEFPLQHITHKYSFDSLTEGEFSKPVDIRARFEPTGMFWTGKKGIGIAEYELADVNPKYWKGNDEDG